ncbi:MAG TPA: VOC family protein [Methylomirabilota bacterium]|nr:VOC family protein [Methylomirabilota bacterium]
MPERDPAERLDELVETILTRGGPGAGAVDDAQLAALLRLAADLRGLPREDFRERLEAQLAITAARAPRGDDMITAITHVRAGFHAITPYLRIPQAADLLEFMTRAFGATETFRTIGSAGGLHAEARIEDSMVMVGGFEGMSAMPTAFHLYVEDADSTYRRALAAGAITLHPPVDQSYGDREASVRDPFGNHWYIATHTATPRGGHRPTGLRAVTPYLHRDAGGLIDFLKAAFAAEETDRHQSPDGVIHHAKVRIGDSFVEMGEAHGQWQPMPAAFYLYVEDADALYARALRAGATSVQPPADQPYGDRTAHVRDPHDNVWFIATHRPGRSD